MPVASGRAAVTGYGRQTAEGTGLTVPKFETPMGGGLVSPERVVTELPWTFDSQDSAGSFIERTAGILDVQLPVLPVSIVPILQGVIGARTTTGVGPYTHVLTTADSLSFMTWFFRQPGDNYWTLTDSKLNTLELSFNAGSPLQAAVTGMGKTATRAATKWGAATVTDTVDPFFTMINSTIKLDSATTPATTTVRNITSGSVSINRNIEAIQSDGFGWQFMAEGKRDVTCSLPGVVFLDNDFINTIFTGSTTGTTISTATAYGSLEFTFLGSDQAAAATRSLKLSCPKMLYTIERIPAADPGGAAVRYDITGAAAKPTTGSTITATVINADAGTNY